MEVNTKSSLEKHKKIFVNRSLNLGNIKWIGFDMDHTLAAYNSETFEDLAFKETLNKFLEAGYPPELSRLKFRPGFLIRGLLVDKERGNLLKIDAHKYVKVAYHGLRRLTKLERHVLYNAQIFKAQNFLSVDTFFALSEVQLFCEIVQFMEENPSRIQKSYEEVYNDLRLFIDTAHRDGSIKKHVLLQPEKYIKKDKHLANTLIRLIDSGKSLFLLTNSMYDYTQVVMNYLLSDGHEEFSCWKDYFEIIICGSSKPGFFLGNQQFYEIDEPTHMLRLHSGPFIKGKVYHGGNAKLLEKEANFKGDETLYVGDHIYTDIMQSKGSLNWRTLLILEELELELSNLSKAKQNLDEIYLTIDTKEHLDEQIQKTKAKISTTKRQMHFAKKRGDDKKLKSMSEELPKFEQHLEEQTQHLDEIQNEIKNKIEARSLLFHPTWGELMKVGLERSRFAYQVSLYACIYTAKITNLRFYSPNKRFFSYNETLPHEFEKRE